MKNIFILIFFSLLISCEKYDEKKDLPSDTTEVVPVEIIRNNDNDKTLGNNIFSEEENIKEDKHFEKPKDKMTLILEKANIDPISFYIAQKKAKKGSNEDIRYVLKVYEKLNMNDEKEKYIDLAIKNNVQEVILNKITQYINENKIDELEKLIPKLKSKKERDKFEGIYLYKKGLEAYENSNSNQAIDYFKKAYKKGVKELGHNIASLYLKQKNINEAVNWLEISKYEGNKDANYELSVIYFNNKKYAKAIPYLIEEYKKGKKELATSIGVCYVNLYKYEEAIVWLEKASSNGDIDAKKIIEKINGFRKESYNVY